MTSQTQTEDTDTKHVHYIYIYTRSRCVWIRECWNDPTSLTWFILPDFAVWSHSYVVLRVFLVFVFFFVGGGSGRNVGFV